MQLAGPGDRGRRAQPRLAVLREPRGQAIAARLGIGEAARAPMCLGCHATPAGRRGVRFQTSDGVGCESCHGPASGWLASHYAVGGTHAAQRRARPRPARKPARARRRVPRLPFRQRRPGQFVTHRIMAAGHPRISFELDLFSTLQQHHNDDADYAQRKGRADGVRMWAVGQAMALDRSLTLFIRARAAPRASSPNSISSTATSCHRRISDDPRFRAERYGQSGPADPVRHAALSTTRT